MMQALWRDPDPYRYRRPEPGCVLTTLGMTGAVAAAIAAAVAAARR